MIKRPKIGLVKINAEPGEKRDFLPTFVEMLVNVGYQVFLEQGYGEGMGFNESDYLALALDVRFVPREVAFQQDYVLVLRYPGDEVVRRMRPGVCLISMLHYPTRPNRVALMREHQVEGVSLDSLKDDTGRRLVENLQSVAWNGLEVAMEVLKKTYPSPGFESPLRAPLSVLIMGSGGVGAHAVQAAIRYGSPEYHQTMASRGVKGVKVTVVDFDLTPNETLMKELLRTTDLLIDATQRPDASSVIIPNDWVGLMPEHAVLLDLSVDPYDFNVSPPIQKGIEGIPQGNLDQYVFSPDDPAYDRIPPDVDNENRRYAISCYSWPGIHPKECMDVYGKQLRPIMRTIFESGGVHNVRLPGKYFQRAIHRAMLSTWVESQKSLM